MQNNFVQEVKKLKNKEFADKKILEIFIRKSKREDPFIKQFSSSEHFCSFFLPIDITSRSIYLVDHIKAKMWIPPGGHIEKNESPKDTVMREFKEELGYTLKKERIDLFTLSITTIEDPKRTCKIHFDFWYAVFIPKRDFRFLRKEFHDGRWFSFEKGLQLISQDSYRTILKKFTNIYYNR